MENIIEFENKLPEVQADKKTSDTLMIIASGLIVASWAVNIYSTAGFIKNLKKYLQIRKDL